MILKTLLKQYTWLSIASILWEVYPDEKKSSEGYQEVFEKLLLMLPQDSEMAIMVTHCKDNFDGEEYVNVSGEYLHPKNEEETYSHAIEFTPWQEWLGMEIHPESLDHFTELEIIAHCLYEMTFIGFEEEEIQEEMNRIKDISDDFKNMNDEEKEANTTSLEDFLEDLKRDDTTENE